MAPRGGDRRTARPGRRLQGPDRIRGPARRRAAVDLVVGNTAAGRCHDHLRPPRENMDRRGGAGCLGHHPDKLSGHAHRGDAGGGRAVVHGGVAPHQRRVAQRLLLHPQRGPLRRSDGAAWRQRAAPSAGAARRLLSVVMLPATGDRRDGLACLDAGRLNRLQTRTGPRDGVACRLGGWLLALRDETSQLRAAGLSRGGPLGCGCRRGRRPARPLGPSRLDGRWHCVTGPRWRDHGRRRARGRTLWPGRCRACRARRPRADHWRRLSLALAA